MLDKLLEHVKRNLWAYAWGFGISLTAGVSLLLVFLYTQASGAISLMASLLLLLGFGFGLVLLLPGALAALFGQIWLGHLHELGKQLGSKDRNKRMDALNKLRKWGRRSVPIFVSVLSAPSGQFDDIDWDGETARRLAAQGLGILRAKEGVEALISVLDDPDTVLRETAVWALGRIGDQRAIPHLLSLLGEPLPFVKCVRKALREMGMGEIVSAWSQVLEHRSKEAVEILRPYRNEIGEALLRGLEQNVFSEEVALNAVWTLGELGAANAIQNLHSLALKHPSAKVRQMCSQVAEKLELISTLPRPVSPLPIDTSTLPSPATFREIDTASLPAIPDETSSKG